MTTEVIVTQQFCGPPNSGNGGYVCGLMAGALDGTVTGILRAPVPLNSPLTLSAEDGMARLVARDGTLVAEAQAADPGQLPTMPPAPGLEAARLAGKEFVGLKRMFHPICFTCGTDQAEGFGLRVFVGPVGEPSKGEVAGVWTPHPSFAGEDGLTRLEVVWAALDCPGSVAWVERESGGGLLGTMTGLVSRRPAPGEPCIVTAFPIEASGRKRISATALFSAEGELLAQSRQIWIVRAPAPA